MVNIYLAMPIDQVENATKEYEAIIAALGTELNKTGEDWAIFSPVHCYFVSDFSNKESQRFIIATNKAALLTSDLVVMVYAPRAESWGLPIELYLAHQANVPVFLLSEMPYEGMPVYLAGHLDRENIFRGIIELAVGIEKHMNPPIIVERDPTLLNLPRTHNMKEEASK